MNKLLRTILSTGLFSVVAMQAQAEAAATLNDVQIAHVAYTAEVIDIRYARLALALSNNPDIHDFARTMIRDHEAVHEQALALLNDVGAEAKDNFLSQKIIRDAESIADELSTLRGTEFDFRYAQNELAFHRAVNGLIAESIESNIENDENSELFEAGLKIFKSHEDHANLMIKKLNLM